VEFSTFVHFTRLVSDSASSERIFSLLGRTVVEECRAVHALVFGTDESGDFTVLSSYGNSGLDPNRLDLNGVCSIAELRGVVIKGIGGTGYLSRVFPLISDAALFGALVVLYSESDPLDEKHWVQIEGLTELTAISLNKTYQHQKLQKAFDELRMSQDALIRAEKLRALGQMSAGVAHDLRNFLNPLMMYTDLLRDSAGQREEVLEIAQSLDRILQRGLETVERLRDFSRQSAEDTEAVRTDLNDIVKEAIQISKPRLHQIDLVLKLGDAPKAFIRPADGVSAIVNLIFNAVDALEGKGRITISTGTSSGKSWVEVADNGPGIPSDIKDRILEPFFTTKGELGTGLGVSIVDAFTQQHGGRLDIESEPGKGARFRMQFPSPDGAGGSD
jgi:signal transduction histidine kinase